MQLIVQNLLIKFPRKYLLKKFKFIIQLKNNKLNTPNKDHDEYEDDFDNDNYDSNQNSGSKFEKNDL